MVQIFSQPVPQHPWCPVISNWIKTQSSPYHSIAANIEVDDRVEFTRRASIEAEVAIQAGALYDGLEIYFRKMVQNASTPEFQKSGLSRITGIPDNTLLATVLDLSGLFYVPGIMEQVELRIGLPPTVALNRSRTGADADYFNWTLGVVDPSQAPTATQRSFVSHLLEVLGGFPRNPVWVTKLDELTPHLPHGPERWLEAVGVSKATPGRFLAVIAYPKCGIELFRPCFADAVTYAWHYPTPAGASLQSGGRAMDLLDVGGQVPQLPLFEAIHAHCGFNNGEFVRIGVTQRAVGCQDVVGYRRRHKKVLAGFFSSFSNDILAWPD